MVGNLIGISIISLGIGVAESTGAQEEAEELATEITIAARLPEVTKNTKGLPSHITIIGSEEIKKSAANSISELLKFRAGIITPDTSGTGAFAGIRMRGFGEKPGTAILIDGIRVEDGGTGNSSLSEVALEDIDRIEILRGGSSVNYGAGAIAGVINIITKSGGQGTNFGSLFAEIGSFGKQSERLSASGTLSKFKYRASVTRQKREGWRDYSGHEAWLFSFKPEYLFDTGRLTLSMRHSDIIDENPGAIDLVSWSENPSSSDPKKHTKYDSRETRTSLTWTSTSSTTTVMVAKVFGHHKISDLESFWGASRIKQPGKGYAIEVVNEHEFFGLEHRFSIGHEFETKDYQSAANWGNSNIDWQNIGFFAQDAIRLDTNTDLTVGLRHDDREWEIFSLNHWNKTGRAWSPKLSLSRNLEKNLEGWVSLSRSFRFPTGDDIAYSSNLYGITSNPRLKPIDAHTIECGLRIKETDSFDGSLVYYLGNVERDIVFDPASGTFGENVNHDTNRQGIELSLRSNKYNGWQPFIESAWTQSRFDGGPYKAKDLPLVPKWQISAGIDFKFNDFWSARVEGLGIAKQTPINDLQNELPKNGYFISNASVRYDRENLGLFLAVNNLSDEDYETYPTSSGGIAYKNPAPGIGVRTGITCRF